MKPKKESSATTKEIEKQVKRCGKIHADNITKLRDEGVDPLAYATSAIDIGLYTLRNSAPSDDEFIKAVTKALELKMKQVCEVYRRDVRSIHEN
jgi:hypothetical protein